MGGAALDTRMEERQGSALTRRRRVAGSCRCARRTGGNDVILRELLGYETLDVVHFHISECLVNVRAGTPAQQLVGRERVRTAAPTACVPSDVTTERLRSLCAQISPTKLKTVPTLIELGTIDVVLQELDTPKRLPQTWAAMAQKQLRRTAVSGGWLGGPVAAARGSSTLVRGTRAPCRWGARTGPRSCATKSQKNSDSVRCWVRTLPCAEAVHVAASSWQR